MTDSIFRRLLFLALALIAATLFLIDIEVRHYLENREIAVTQQRLSITARLLTGDLSNLREPGLQAWVDSAAAKAQMRVTLVDGAGQVVADSVKDAASVENQARRQEIAEALQRNTGSVIDNGTVYFALLLPERGGTPLVLKLSAPVAVDEAGRGLRVRIFGISLGSATLALLVAFLISRSLSQRVARLKRVAAGMIESASQERAFDDPGDDLASLERSLAGVAGELRRLLDRLHWLLNSCRHLSDR